MVYMLTGKPKWKHKVIPWENNYLISIVSILSKIKKQWILNNEIIDINNYKPVSTILGSEE